MRFCLFVLLVAVVLLPRLDASEEGWVVLFNGTDLSGWTEKAKSGNFRVEEGVIVGTAVEGLGSTFLCSDSDYGDFELEFETKLIDPELNSGVQIRSKTKEPGVKQKYGAVYGPQVEVAQGRGDKGYSGNIFGQSSGGWITPKEERMQHSFMKEGEWNHFRVLAVGDQIMTWINGNEVTVTTVPAEKHAANARGFIGLQIHGIKDGTGPFEAAWRNIRIKLLGTDSKPSTKNE